MPLLKSDSDLCSSLRSKYLSSFKAAKRVIGISWRGGGRADRIKQKSLPIDLFTNVLTGFEDVVFVSLQYGESESVVNDWKKQGIHVIHDSSVDPLKILRLGSHKLLHVTQLSVLLTRQFMAQEV